MSEKSLTFFRLCSGSLLICRAVQSHAIHCPHFDGTCRQRPMFSSEDSVLSSCFWNSDCVPRNLLGLATGDQSFVCPAALIDPLQVLVFFDKLHLVMIHCTVVQLASFARRGPSSTAISHNVRLHRFLLSKRHDLRLAINSAQKVGSRNVFFGLRGWNCSWSHQSVWQELQDALSVLTSFRQANGTYVQVESFELLLRGCVFCFPLCDIIRKMLVAHWNRAFANACGVRFYVSSEYQCLSLSLSSLTLQTTNIVKDPFQSRRHGDSPGALPCVLFCKKNPHFSEEFDSSGWTKWSCRDVSLNTYTYLGTTINYI